jgi:hypothetical protein
MQHGATMKIVDVAVIRLLQNQEQLNERVHSVRRLTK